MLPLFLLFIVGKLSDILMKVNLNVIDNRQCNSFYNRGLGTDASFSSGIVDTMLCAGVLEGGRDSCLVSGTKS